MVRHRGKFHVDSNRLSGVTFENGGQVQAVFTNDDGTATTNAGTLTVPWIFLSECPDLPSGQVQASPGKSRQSRWLPRLVAHLTWTPFIGPRS